MERYESLFAQLKERKEGAFVLRHASVIRALSSH